jgi:HPt (histidine-containing phosphotransfer) domain-containing protein
LPPAALSRGREFILSLGALASTGGHLPGSPAIDRTVLAEWLSGDNNAINALLGLFHESIDAEAVRMRDLLAQDAFDQFAGAAHRLRGAALSMGARALAEFVGLLFTAALARDRNACVKAMPGLAAHVQRVEADIPGRILSAAT